MLTDSHGANDDMSDEIDDQNVCTDPTHDVNEVAHKAFKHVSSISPLTRHEIAACIVHIHHTHTPMP